MRRPGPRVAFVHGRPAAHPNRVRLLRHIGADFIPVDFRLPWADLADPSRVRMGASLLACALTFPSRGRYDLFLGDGPQFLPVVMKQLGLLRRGQKVVPYLANETPYFLATGWYGPRKTRLLARIFNMWDGYLCVGDMMAELTRRLLGPARDADIFTITNFIRRERFAALGTARPKLDSADVLFVANGPGGFRTWYKGLDLMLDAFRLARKENPGLRFTVVGAWDGNVLKHAEDVRFVGPTDRVRQFIEESSLYLHCSRGDAWPNSVMEAMCAGLPPLISDWTGGREAVVQVSADLIAPLDAATIAKRICWYMDLPPTEKHALSDLCRHVSATYTEERAVARFLATLDRLLRHFNLPGLPHEDAGEMAERGI